MCFECMSRYETSRLNFLMSVDVRVFCAGDLQATAHNPFDGVNTGRGSAPAVIPDVNEDGALDFVVGNEGGDLILLVSNFCLSLLHTI